MDAASARFPPVAGVVVRDGGAAAAGIAHASGCRGAGARRRKRWPVAESPAGGPAGARAGLSHRRIRAAADGGHRRERGRRGNRHRARAGHLQFDAGRGPDAEPHRGGQGGGRRFHRRASRRPHRPRHLRGQGLHPGSAHAGLLGGHLSDCRARCGDHRGRHRGGDGAGHRGQAPAGERGRVEGGHSADRRAQQPGRDRPGHGGAGSPGAGCSRLYRRRGCARHGQGPGPRPLRGTALRHHAGRCGRSGAAHRRRNHRRTLLPRDGHGEPGGHLR